MSDISYALGIDLGGTKIEVGIVNHLGEIVQKTHCKTNVSGGYQTILKELSETIHSLTTKFNSPINGIGIGIAGQVNKESGEVIFAPNLEWHHVPLQEDIAQQFHLPVIVTNDVRAVTVGEWVHGEGQGFDDLVCIFIGTGIGGGIICNGHLLEGSSNTAGEIGHMIIDFHGPYCTCGSRGCWEAHAGGWAIAKKARQAVTDFPKEGSKLMELVKGLQGTITANTVSEALRENDPLAKKIMEEVTQAIISGTINMINIFNPSCLILGGGIIDGFPFLFESVEKGVRKHALRASTEKLSIVKSKLSYEAGIIGAATLIHTHTGAGQKFLT